MVELLAPAGNFTSLSAALKNGADSIYIGLKNKFNMRANTTNFKIEEVEKAVKQVKKYNSKLYVCTNTILKDQDIEQVKKQLPTLKSYGVDGIILSDLGLIHHVTENNLEAHLSVQENTTNTETLKILKELGVKRAILSRELNLNEVKNIAQKSPIETEIFIHGAMCMAISGRCFLSAGLYGRSANCGDCLQPCRKEWKLTYAGNKKSQVQNQTECEDESFIIQEAYDDTYHTNFFSPKDLALIEHIPELMETKVNAFKIEGRGRSPDYVATATKIYSQAIIEYENGNYTYKKEWMDELNNVFNRGFDTGFYFKTPHEKSQDNQSKYIKKDIGQVVNYYNKIQVAEIKIWDEIKLNDTIMIQGPTTGSITHKIKSMQIDKKPINKAQKGTNVAIKINEKLRESDHIYKLIKRE